jgi:hypothetical protein
VEVGEGRRSPLSLARRWSRCSAKVPDERASKACGLFGERLLVLQRRQLFHGPFVGAGAWTAIDVDGHDGPRRLAPPP